MVAAVNVGPRTAQNKGREGWIEIARVVGVAAVLLLHLTDPLYYHAQSIDRVFWTSILVHYGSLWAVPLFLMVSGYLALRMRPEGPLLAAMRQSAFRVVPGLLAFSAIYGLLGVAEGVSTPQHLLAILIKPYYHLWYVYLLFWLLLLAPCFRLALRRLLPVEQLLLAVVALAYGVAAHALNVLLGAQIGYWQQFPLYVGFFLLGSVLGTWRINISSAILVGVLVLSSGANVLLGWRTFGHSSWLSYLSGPDYPLGIFTAAGSICLFILIRKWLQGAKSNRWVTPIAGASYGIYLIHPLLLNFVAVNQQHPVGGVLVAFVLLFSSSLALIMLLQRTPLRGLIV